MRVAREEATRKETFLPLSSKRAPNDIFHFPMESFSVASYSLASSGLATQPTSAEERARAANRRAPTIIGILRWTDGIRRAPQHDAGHVERRPTLKSLRE